MHRFLCTILILLVLTPAAVRAQSDSAPEIFRLDEIEPGQIGFGLSVFSGIEPERFDVEVLGVWRNTSPDTSFILARLDGQGLDESGVIAGMSGSPVYIEGKLAGAVSFAWPFSLEPIAGITPIESMHRLLHGSEMVGPGGIAGQESDALGSIASLDFPDDLLEERRDEIRSRRLLVLKELDRDRPNARVDPAQLRTALGGVLAKAVAVVPDHGDVYLASRHHAAGLNGMPMVRILLRYNHRSASSAFSGGESIVVDGMSPRETALEMLIAEHVVNAHGGSLVVDTSEGQETVVIIDLPAPPTSQQLASFRNGDPTAQ
jgi:hypothetical protein